MFRQDGAGECTVQEILRESSLARTGLELVVVTNEIFSDGICYDPETTRYQTYLGEINRWLGKWAGQVIEVVYGIPIYLKDNRKEEQLNEAALEQF